MVCPPNCALSDLYIKQGHPPRAQIKVTPRSFIATRVVTGRPIYLTTLLASALASVSMVRRNLPRHRHIDDWTEYALMRFILRRRTFHDKLTDKSYFYHCCSAQWDKASPLSYQYTDDIKVLEKWVALAAESIRPGETIVDYGPG
jgi:hypothetical protein